MPLFRTGNGTDTDTIIIALELVSPDWFRRNLIGALELMCKEENWEQVGDADVQFARDKANEMLEGIQIDVIIPVLPVGTIDLWLGATPPAKWLILDGSSKLAATYAELFALYGYTYGGSGANFSLPDMRNRLPIGAGSDVGLGVIDGSKTKLIDVLNLPSHTHAVSQTPHHHPPVSPATVYVGRHATGSTDWIRATSGATFDQMSNTGDANANITIGNTGSDQAFNVLNPVRGMHYIVYAGV